MADDAPVAVVKQVQDLQQVCPELTEEEARRALELCSGRWVFNHSSIKILPFNSAKHANFLASATVAKSLTATT